jgi:hypothetical protein
MTEPDAKVDLLVMWRITMQEESPAQRALSLWVDVHILCISHRLWAYRGVESHQATICLQGLGLVAETFD